MLPERTIDANGFNSFSGLQLLKQVLPCDMAENQPPSVPTPNPAVVAKPKPPIIGCQVTPQFRDRIDGLRDLFVGLTPDGRANRSTILRAILSQGEALLDREYILGVRGIAKRDGIEMPDAWRKVIAAGIAALKGKR